MKEERVVNLHTTLLLNNKGGDQRHSECSNDLWHYNTIMQL